MTTQEEILQLLESKSVEKEFECGFSYNVETVIEDYDDAAKCLANISERNAIEFAVYLGLNCVEAGQRSYTHRKDNYRNVYQIETIYALFQNK